MAENPIERLNSPYDFCVMGEGSDKEEEEGEMMKGELHCEELEDCKLEMKAVNSQRKVETIQVQFSVKQKVRSEDPDKKLERCNCLKSRCLRLYCECFSKGRLCGADCKCEGCLNRSEFEQQRNFVISDTQRQNSLSFRPKLKHLSKSRTQINARGCSCVKTSCIKMYCECFRSGVGCSRLCRCSHCKNEQIELEDSDVPALYERAFRKRARSIDFSYLDPERPLPLQLDGSARKPKPPFKARKDPKTPLDHPKND